MVRATVSELKNHLSAYLRRVKAGETVLILDRTRPIARIERVAGTEGIDQWLAELAAAGLARLPTRPLPIKQLKAKRPRSRRSVLEALLEERSEGR
jgi:prevent-host-death family protein